MKQYVKSIDAMRVMAILAVILIHTTTRTLEAAKFNLAGFPVSIFLNQIARFAVPLFFIISGFVLEISWDDGLNYFSFIKKRFSRIFIPYIFWSVIYYFFVYNQNPENFIQVILKGDASYQLYFIPTLCIFYLLFPLLHRFYSFISNKSILVLLFVSEALLLYRDYFINTFKYPDPVHIAILSYFFFIIGIVAAHKKEMIMQFTKKWKYIIFPVVILSGIYVFWEGFSRFMITNNYFNYYSQWRPSILVYTITIGLILFYLFEKPTFQLYFIQKLSKLSFLVFLIHVIVLEEVWSSFGKSLFNLLSGNIFAKIIFDPIFFGKVAGISFVIAYILHKIPRLNKLLG